MKEEQKKKIQRRYQEAKQDGVKFWPDIIYKDLLMSFGIFLLLVGLAAFVGIAAEAKADPSDTSYIPRPEWYFLFLFEFLKFIPGQLEWVGTTLIPLLGVAILFALPFIDKSPTRFWKNRPWSISLMGAVVLGMIGLTVRAVITTPEQEETTLATTIQEKVILGQDLYSIHCVECHGPEGGGGEVIGVEGMEGVVLKPINSQDEMYTRSDDTLEAIINYGQQELGMPPYGLAYGGPLQLAEIEAMVTFMRYTWDDRVEIPPEAAAAGAVPELREGEVPSYENHISKIVKRYCVSCHREGKENNNYLMGSYQEMLSTGDSADKNLIPGDLDSYLIQTINGNSVYDPETGEEITQQMPPTKLLKEEYIAIFEAWVLNGMPETAEQAEALSPTPTPAAELQPEE
ncbi:MAG: c-type cytochrome [Anaerolineales bacterium]|nr:c-type cytochrome [Anaerolineales bacterium]